MTDRPLSPGSTLLVDLDGVVAEQLPRLCRYLRREYDHHVSPDEIDHWSYEIPGVDGHVGHVIEELMLERPEWYLSGMKPHSGVADTLSVLRSEYRIEIATHRLPETHDISKAWLDEHEIGYDAFHETVPENKGALDGDALIDDYHGHVENAISAGKTGVLMRQPYNDPDACDGAHVVDSWDDVRTLFSV